MKLDYETGKIYDTVMAANYCFNYETYIEYFNKKNFNNPEKKFEYFDEIKDKLDFIPKDIYPILYFDGEKAAPISSFFLYKVNKENLDLEGFIDIINDDNIFKKYLFDYIFDIDFELAGINLIHERISNMDVSIEYKFELLKLIQNYDNVKDILIRTLQRIYPLVSKLHDKHIVTINSVFNTAEKEDMKNRYANHWNIDKNRIKNSLVGYSLINKYLIFYTSKFNTQIVLGINNIENLLRKVDESQVSHIKFLNTLSNETKIEIIEKLYEYRELTKADLGSMLYVSNSTIGRYVDDLFGKSLIMMSRHESVKIYFSINKDYFKLIKPVLNNFIDKLIMEKNA